MNLVCSVSSGGADDTDKGPVVVRMKRAHGRGARLRIPVPRRPVAAVESASRVAAHVAYPLERSHHIRAMVVRCATNGLAHRPCGGVPRGTSGHRAAVALPGRLSYERRCSGLEVMY